MRIVVADRTYTKAEVEDLIESVLKDPKVIRALTEQGIYMAIAEDQNEHKWIANRSTKDGAVVTSWVCTKCGLTNTEADAAGKVFCDVGDKQEP